MSVIILILLVSICIAGAFLIGFLWSVKDGQFDDVNSPAQRILFDASAGSAYENSSAGSAYENASANPTYNDKSTSNPKKTNNK